MNRRKVLKILLGVSLLILLSLIYYVSEETIIEKETKIVTKIIDGDTIVVQGGQTIRLLDIDCDERGKTCYDDAKEYIETRLLNSEVELVSGSEDEDIYNRKLRYIFLNGVNINQELVEKGYCVARFVSDNEFKAEIENAESYAISNRIGCKWGNLRLNK